MLDPTFKTSVEVFDNATQSTTTCQIGVDNAGDNNGDDEGGNTTPLHSFSPPFRWRPVHSLNPVLVALALDEKFGAYEHEGAEIPPYCLPYKERVSRLIEALDYEVPPATHRLLEDRIRNDSFPFNHIASHNALSATGLA